MLEASRNDARLKNPQYPEGAERATTSPATSYSATHSVPEGSLPSGNIYRNSRVNRSAQAVGRGVGSAVSGVRQFPQRVNQASSHLRRAGRTTRANVSAAVLEMMDTAAQRADNLRRTTGETLSNLAQTARAGTSRLTEQAADNWQHLRRVTRARLDYTGRRALGEWNNTQRTVAHWQREDPVRFLAVVAGTAFVIGAGLRIWRSAND